MTLRQFMSNGWATQCNPVRIRFGNHDRFGGRYLETSCEVTGEDGLALLKILV